MCEDKMTPQEEARVGTALALGEQQERDKTIQEVWDAINAQITMGPLSGNGCDDTAERNGMIKAANIAMTMVKQPTVREMTDFEHKLVSLLDRIEIEDNPRLAALRFKLAEEQGYTVVITGECTSGAVN